MARYTQPTYCSIIFAQQLNEIITPSRADRKYCKRVHILYIIFLVWSASVCSCFYSTSFCVARRAPVGRWSNCIRWILRDAAVKKIQKKTRRKNFLIGIPLNFIFRPNIFIFPAASHNNNNRFLGHEKWMTQSWFRCWWLGTGMCVFNEMPMRNARPQYQNKWNGCCCNNNNNKKRAAKKNQPFLNRFKVGGGLCVCARARLHHDDTAAKGKYSCI